MHTVYNLFTIIFYIFCNLYIPHFRGIFEMSDKCKCSVFAKTRAKYLEIINKTHKNE